MILNAPADQTMPLIRKWADNCFSGAGRHDVCKIRHELTQKSFKPPQRLVRLEKEGDVIAFRIVETRELLRQGSDEAAYVTISAANSLSKRMALDPSVTEINGLQAERIA